MADELRARAAAFERERRYPEALALYAQVLSEDATDLATMKRCIAVRRAAGEAEAAQAALMQLLGTFPADTEAWLEAAEAAAGRADMEGAAFALEEAVLAAPENHHVVTHYAEALFTHGGAEQRALARRYFAVALELCPGSLRALYGLHLSAHAALAALPRTAKDKERAAAAELLRWSGARLAEAHGRGGDATAKRLCTEMVAALGGGKS